MAKTKINLISKNIENKFIMNPSPLRYPGSKNKFYSIVKHYLVSHNTKNPSYAEPYVGGASVGLKLLLNKEVSKIHINDLDKNIYSFWYSILHHTEEFISKIISTEVTITQWKIQKETLKTSNNILDIGFATFYLNRTNFSGIIKGGPIGGLEQKGKYKIDCRFNKTKLIEKIKTIVTFKDKIKIYNLDALDFIKEVDKKKNVFIYIDPPYYNKGKELYMSFYKDDNHKELEQIIRNIKNKWLLSYDKCEFIEDLYNNYNIDTKPLFYSAGYKKIGNELLIKNCL